MRNRADSQAAPARCSVRCETEVADPSDHRAEHHQVEHEGADDGDEPARASSSWFEPLVFAVAAAVVVQVARLAAGFPDEEPNWLFRNATLFVFPFLGAYFADVNAIFVVDFADERFFWRSVYQVENVEEAAFFEIAPRAFPSLLFAEGLSFRQFEGGYAVRDEVVRHLAAINDQWTDAYEQEAGNSEAISTRIGISVSREAHQTRASERLMAQRDVLFADGTYRCEWHSKLEPHRNRIHFYPSDASLEGRVLIGIFCDHLSTA